MILEDAMGKEHGKKTRLSGVFRGTWSDVDAEMSGFVTTLHPARIVKRNLPADMAVLDFLPEVRVIVCKMCQSARYYNQWIPGLESILTNHVALRSPARHWWSLTGPTGSSRS